jgi:hypothetical protein
MTFSTYDEIEAYITSQPTGDAPASRYGVKPSQWVPVAAAAATIMANETDDLTPEGIDYIIGLVVNDHDDIEYLIRNYGAEYGFNPEDYLD